MKLNENSLSDYQMGVVQDIARADFDCGHPMSDYDEVLACMEEDEDLCDVATDAADYYLEITADGASSFYAEYDETSSTLDDNDFDEEDDPLYGYGEDDEDFEESLDESIDDVKGRVYSFAFDFIVTGDDLASADEARDRILRDIELVDGIEIVGNPNVDATSWSKAEYGLSEATTKRTSKRSLNEKRVARSENLLKTKDVKKAVLDSFKSYFDDDENFTLAKNFDPAGTLNIQINGKKKVVVAVNVSVDEKSGTYIIDGATAKDKKNLPDLYFKGSSADEAGKDAVAAAKDVAKFAKTLEK